MPCMPCSVFLASSMPSLLKFVVSCTIFATSSDFVATSWMVRERSSMAFCTCSTPCVAFSALTETPLAFFATCAEPAETSSTLAFASSALAARSPTCWLMIDSDFETSMPMLFSARHWNFLTKSPFTLSLLIEPCREVPLCIFVPRYRIASFTGADNMLQGLVDTGNNLPIPAFELVSIPPGGEPAFNRSTWRACWLLR